MSKFKWAITSLGFVGISSKKILNHLIANELEIAGPVTKIENIKTDETKILRPTRFLGPKDIKTDIFFVGLNLWLFFSNPMSRS